MWTLLQPEYNQSSTSTLPLQSPWTTDLRFVFKKATQNYPSLSSHIPHSNLPFICRGARAHRHLSAFVGHSALDSASGSCHPCRRRPDMFEPADRKSYSRFTQVLLFFEESCIYIQAHNTHLSHSTTDHTGGGGANNAHVTSRVQYVPTITSFATTCSLRHCTCDLHTG